jgi:parallel beta-helix repeat protein
LPSLTHSISIDGPGATQLTVRGGDTGGYYRIFTDTGPTVSIGGLTIAGGLNSDGIANYGTLTVTNCTVDSVHGYAILNTGTLTLTNATVRGDTDYSIANYGTLTLDHSTVSDNTQGGGISNDGGTLTLTHCTVSDNIGGTGIFNSDGGTATLTDCTVSGNNVEYTFDTFSGGISNYGGTVTLTDCTISGNYRSGISNSAEFFYFNHTLTLTDCTVSGNEGSGVYTEGGTATLTNCTVSGNSGGGIGNGDGTVTLTDCTISGNYGDYGGGGVANDGTLHARNTIIAGNTAPNGPDVYGDLDSQGHNLIGDGSGGGGFTSTDLVGTATNPIDPKLGPLQDNGGPTPTMALLAGSPALNAGDPAQLGVADQRGVARSGGVNIGAYQASASALVVTGPATATAGTPFDVTVKAVDSFGQTAVGYTGTATFTSADPHGATLPADYHFTLADGGVHTFGAGATLYTAGTWDVTATDTVTASITGAATVAVSPAAADHLLFLQQPTDTAAGQTISPVIVEVVDAFGNVETGDNGDTVTLSIGSNPGGGTLSGTLSVTVVNGVATFSDLAIDLAGAGYTLHATDGGVPDIDSNPFAITM